MRSVHAYLLVIFDDFFFSSGLIAGTVIITTGILFAHSRLVLCRYGHSGVRSIDGSAAMEQAGPSSASSAPPAGTFLRLSLELASEQLYDLPLKIPDVMGLRALRASAAIVKVMSVPDSLCIRVVAPDDHVNIGFHATS